MSSLDEIVEILKIAQDNDKYIAALEGLSKATSSVEAERAELEGFAKEVNERIAVAEELDRKTSRQQRKAEELLEELEQKSKDYEAMRKERDEQFALKSIYLEGFKNRCMIFLEAELKGFTDG